MKAKKLKYVNVLIVLSLLSLAVFNNRTGQNIIIGLVSLWFIVNLFPFLFSQLIKLDFKGYKTEESIQKDDDIELIAAYEKAILLHFNCRITDALKVTYPNVSWQWHCFSPITHGVLSDNCPIFLCRCTFDGFYDTYSVVT